MQQSKAAVEVKQVIGALCSLLSATGLDPVPAPDTFRRAKFGGGPEVEDQFWQLLASILQTAGVVSCEARSQLRGASEHRKLVAAGLWQTGYYADWMLEREGGERQGAGRSSSRELLLALGWLLAAGSLEKLLTQRVQQLDKTLLTPLPVNPPQLSNELQIDSTSLRKLQWLVGRLRNQQRILLSVLEERTHLLHSVFAILPSISSSHHSSVVLQEDCVCLQQLCDLLEAYLNWKQAEKVFWTWMDSVVDGLTDPLVKMFTHAPNGSRRRCHHGNRGLEKLDDMLLRLPTGQEGQTRGRREAEVRGGGREWLLGESDASSPLPLLSSHPSLTSLPRVYRARLQTERPVKHSSHSAEAPRSKAEAADYLPSSQVVQLLLQKEAMLLERRDKQRLANRMWLQELVGRLDNLVLIAP